MRVLPVFRLLLVMVLLSFALGSAAIAQGHVTVGNCTWLDEAEAFKVSAQFDWSASGADRFGTSTIRRSWQADAIVPMTDAYGSTIEYSFVGAPDEAVSASFMVEDVYAYDGYTDSERGAGAATEVYIYVMVDSRTCEIDAEFQVLGEVMSQSPQGSGTGTPGAGLVQLFGVQTVEEFLGGTLELPHSKEVGINESNYFGGWFSMAEVVLADANLGTATFTWSLEPVNSQGQ